MKKNRTLKLTIITGLSGLLIFVFIKKSFTASSEVSCENALAPVQTHKINFLKERSPLETSIVRLNNQFYYVLSYMSGPQSSYHSTPTYVYPINEKGKISETPMLFGESQHVRSVTQINTPWGEGILMADHGVDGNGFPGGNVILIVADKKEHKLVDMSASLNQKKNFAFNAVGVRRSHSRYDDILIAPYNSPNARVVYLKATERGYVDATQLLPEEWRKFKVCFMTAAPFDTDLDGRDEIVLGSCDLNPEQNPVERDRLLVWKNSRWNFSSMDSFPLRKQLATWGTVYWLKNDRDLIALTHNKGFTKADLQYLSYEKKTKKFIEVPIQLDSLKRDQVPHYFHKIQKLNDTFFGLIRYGATPSPGPNLLALKRAPNGAWREEKVCLVIPPKEVVLGIDSFTDNQGRSSLILTYYSGRYDIFQ